MSTSPDTDRDPLLDERRNKTAWLLLPPLLLLFVTLVMVFVVFFDSRAVEGDSMLPTLRHGDRLLVTKDYEDAVRGDIVVVEIERAGRRTTFLKRVAALPGDEVVVEGDRVWVNGRESAPVPIIVGDSGAPMHTVEVPEDTLVVLGDNRPISLDSRFIGVIEIDKVLGRAVAIYAPFYRLRFVDVPGDRD